MPYDEMQGVAEGKAIAARRVPRDVIEPVSIRHEVDEAFDVELNLLEYRYNFIVYEFDTEAGRVWARTYLDEMEKVALGLPEGMSMHHPDVARVVHFLKRRFATVETMGPSGYYIVDVEYPEAWLKPSGGSAA